MPAEIALLGLSRYHLRVIWDPEIQKLRVAIDGIDHAILRLLGERARVVLEVGDRKREQALPVYDPAREQALLDRLAGDREEPLDHAAVIAVFSAIVEQCRRLEEAHMDVRSE